MKVADVVVDRTARGLDRAWTYLVPESMDVGPGYRVSAPFGRGQVQGIVLAVRESVTDPEMPLKPLSKVVDDYPLLSPVMLELGEWMAQRYLCFLIQAYKAMIPRSLRPQEPARDFVEALGERHGRPSKKQQLWEYVYAHGPLPREQLLSEIPGMALSLRALVTEGFLAVRRVVPGAAKRRAVSSPFVLNQEQDSAVRRIMDGPPGSAWLLEGVTGSGKTEVYLQTIAKTLEAGGQALVLVPEIALTPQTVMRFEERFPDMVGLWHSGLTGKERAQTWHDVRTGRARIVVGVRSSVFLPFAALRLIVIDEEHESTYKQDDHPRYHTRDIALWLARRTGLKVVMGSATPSLETAFFARQGTIGWIRLTARVGARALPPVALIDMRQELEEGNHSIFSRALQEAVTTALNQGEQVILFLNRRGYASFVLCRSCGKALECPRCAVTLTYHQDKDLLVCHYCFHTMKPPKSCPACGSSKIRYFGAGTERVAEEVAKLWPTARVARADRDTLKTRDSYYKLYFDFVAHESDVLVGTQMIAKGMDFPNVTVVGVVAADVALNLPDFRRAERTFQLLVQASGRTGRGERPGRVFVQTYDPENFAIASAATHNYDAFFDQEIEYRRELNYPPFGGLWLIEVSDEDSPTAQKNIRKVAERLKCLEGEGCEVLGPAPAPLPKLRERYRYHVLVKGPESLAVTTALADLPTAEWNCSITVDPYYML